MVLFGPQTSSIQHPLTVAVQLWRQEGGWCGHQDFIRLHVLGMEGCLILVTLWWDQSKGKNECFGFLCANFFSLKPLYFWSSEVVEMKHYNRTTAQAFQWEDPWVPYWPIWQGMTMWGYVTLTYEDFHEHEPQSKFGILARRNSRMLLSFFVQQHDNMKY